MLQALKVVRVRIPLPGVAHVGLHHGDPGLQHAPRQEQRLPEDVPAILFAQFGRFILQGEGLGQPTGGERVAGGALLIVELPHRGMRVEPGPLAIDL